MSSNSVSPNELDSANVTITDPRKRKSEKTKTERIVSLMLYNQSPAYFETPLCRAPFGINTYAKGDTGISDYSLNLSLDPEDNFTKQCANIDNLMIDYGVKHSKMLFGKQYTPEQRPVVEALYTPMLKEGKIDGDNHYPPRIAPKILRKHEDATVPNVLFYHSKDEEVDVESFDHLIDLVPKGSSNKTLIVPRPWFISGRFGTSLNVLQILAPKRKSMRPKSFAFNDELGATEKVAQDEFTNEEDEVVETKNDASSSVENTDDGEEGEEGEVEEEEASDEECEPTPPPKKASTKKAAGGTAPRKRATTTRK